MSVTALAVDPAVGAEHPSPTMPVPPFDEDGLLPPGRHEATVAEMLTSLVDEMHGSVRRPVLAERWVIHKQTLEYLIEVLHHWVGGSFTTAKPEPGDIDTVAFIDGVAFDALPEEARRLVYFMCQRQGRAPVLAVRLFRCRRLPRRPPGPRDRHRWSDLVLGRLLGAH